MLRDDHDTRCAAGCRPLGWRPRRVSAGRKLAAWIAPTAAASVLLLGAGFGFWLIGDETPDSFESAPIVAEQTTAHTGRAGRFGIVARPR